MTDLPSRYRQAARERFDTGDGDIFIPEEASVRIDDDREGAWVHAQLFVPIDALDPEPGPTYDVWIAEREDVYATVLDGINFRFPAEPDGRLLVGYRWPWIHDSSLTGDDDPDGRGARAAAHEYARYLRKTYPCAFVAVRPVGKPPLPIAKGCE